MPVVFNAAYSRYELKEGERVLGLLEVQEADGRVTLPHTKIAEEREGQGLGSQLLRGALDDLRAQGKKVVPTCPFAAHFIDTHAEYQDMLA